MKIETLGVGFNDKHVKRTCLPFQAFDTEERIHGTSLYQISIQVEPGKSAYNNRSSAIIEPFRLIASLEGVNNSFLFHAHIL